MNIAVDVTFHAGWWHKYTGICFNEDFFMNPQYRIECDLKMRKLLYDKFGDMGLGEKNPKPRPIMGTDLLASGYLYSSIMGCEVKFYEDRTPEVICSNISDTDMEKVKIPEISGNRIWKDTVKQFDYLEQKFGYVESHINFEGIQNNAMDLRGSSLFIDYYENPVLAKKLLDICTLFSISLGKYISSRSKVMSHGISAIVSKVMPDVYLTANCTVEMISGELYEKFLLDQDNKLAGVFKPFGIHHCGKSMEHVVKGYAKVKDLRFAEVGAGSDITAVRNALPGVFLNLRYSPVKLMTATENEIMEDIERMSVEACSMYSFSCVGIDSETSDEQVRNFLKCVKRLE